MSHPTAGLAWVLEQSGILTQQTLDDLVDSSYFECFCDIPNFLECLKTFLDERWNVLWHPKRSWGCLLMWLISGMIFKVSSYLRVVALKHTMYTLHGSHLSKGLGNKRQRAEAACLTIKAVWLYKTEPARCQSGTEHTYSSAHLAVPHPVTPLFEWHPSDSIYKSGQSSLVLVTWQTKRLA